jgi:hypothetical protein
MPLKPLMAGTNGFPRGNTAQYHEGHDAADIQDHLSSSAARKIQIFCSVLYLLPFIV